MQGVHRLSYYYYYHTSTPILYLQVIVPRYCDCRIGCFRHSLLLPEKMGICFSMWNRTRWPTLWNTWSRVRTWTYKNRSKPPSLLSVYIYIALEKLFTPLNLFFLVFFSLLICHIKNNQELSCIFCKYFVKFL